MAVRAEAPLVPEKLGPYRCLRKLAVGGMGEVYLAEASGAGDFKKRLVIKAVRADRADEKEVVDAFLDEARVWALLTHPNIVPLFDCVWLEGRLCLVMEYIEGADLRELIQAAQAQQRGLTAGVALHLATQVAAGLHAAHEARGPDHRLIGLVHRDVSPHNVLVDRSVNARLCDFGIARSALRRNRTRSGRFKGKFAYVAPEAIRGDEVDRRADLFGMGVMLYEMLALVRPFQGEGPVPLLRAILETEPQALTRIRPDLSVQLCQVVDRALAKDPAERFATAEAFRWALLNTPEGREPPDARQLSHWFDILTGLNEDGPNTEPRLLDLAARAASRSVVDEVQDPAGPISAESFEFSIEQVRTGEAGPRVAHQALTVARERPPPPVSRSALTGDATLPRAKPPAPPRPSPPLEVALPTSPTVLKGPLGPPTYDLGQARTVLKEKRPRRSVDRWGRRAKELAPWLLLGAGVGGLAVFVLTQLHLWGR